MVFYWNERELKFPSSSEWRASLVPAAAVIPAPRAYTNAVDVKKFVVGFRPGFGLARHIGVSRPNWDFLQIEDSGH